MRELSSGPPTIKTFARLAYPEEKLAFERGYVWNIRVLIPGAIRLAWGFAWLGFKPNQITYLSHSVAVVGLLLIARGQTAEVVFGILFINLWQILDCSDGALARATGMTSHYGAFIDYLGGYLTCAALPVTIGFGLYLNPELAFEIFLGRFSWTLGPSVSIILPFLFGVLASFMFMLRSIGGFLYVTESQAKTGFPTRQRELNRIHIWLDRIRWFRRNWLELPGFMLPMLVPLALGRLLSLWLIPFAVLTFLDATAILVLSAMRLHKIDRGIAEVG